jgi:hypothetical protein
MARGQAYNAAAQESGSGGVRDRLAQALLDPTPMGSANTFTGSVNDAFGITTPRGFQPAFQDRFNPQPLPPPLDIRSGVLPNNLERGDRLDIPGRVVVPVERRSLPPPGADNVPLPPSRPAFSPTTSSFRSPVQQRPQPQPARPVPPPPSLIDTFNPFQRVGPINPVPGPTSNFFGAQSGTSPSGDYGSQFRGEMPQNRTVGANYNGPLVNQYGNPRFGGRGVY